MVLPYGKRRVLFTATQIRQLVSNQTISLAASLTNYKLTVPVLAPLRSFRAGLALMHVAPPFVFSVHRHNRSLGCRLLGG